MPNTDSQTSNLYSNSRLYLNSLGFDDQIISNIGKHKNGIEILVKFPIQFRTLLDQEFSIEQIIKIAHRKSDNLTLNAVVTYYPTLKQAPFNLTPRDLVKLASYSSHIGRIATNTQLTKEELDHILSASYLDRKLLVDKYTKMRTDLPSTNVGTKRALKNQPTPPGKKKQGSSYLESQPDKSSSQSEEKVAMESVVAKIKDFTSNIIDESNRALVFLELTPNEQFYLRKALKPQKIQLTLQVNSQFIPGKTGHYSFRWKPEQRDNFLNTYRMSEEREPSPISSPSSLTFFCNLPSTLALDPEEGNSLAEEAMKDSSKIFDYIEWLISQKIIELTHPSLENGTENSTESFKIL